MQALPQVYLIQLPQFEGPFDLLLFFIHRDELNIHDIPIARITKDFLAYLRGMEQQSIELGAEFTLMAAELMKIKASLLVPRPPVREDGSVEDPRVELVSRLLDYTRYRAAAEELAIQEEVRTLSLPRGYVAQEQALIMQQEAEPTDVLYGLNIYHLLKNYQRLVARSQVAHATPRHVIQPYPYTVEAVKEELMQQLETQPRWEFVSLASYRPNRIYAIFVFLCLLELLQQRKVRVLTSVGYNNFWVLAPEESVPAYMPLLN